MGKKIIALAFILAIMVAMVPSFALAKGGANEGNGNKGNGPSCNALFDKNGDVKGLFQAWDSNGGKDVTIGLFTDAFEDCDFD
ncbi:MAG: hypothetical protein H8E48_05005 [Chloroflexi bacterium]|nr:hypothetical protein [Chloroflexota bacterium]